ncbi:MAG: cadmium resistance transporter [Lachnospiraceae bacterium]|nr:cadmium resistance transporter [Lachnospiraceae bacterium]MBR4113333.1 cadmium resistance transporter [Anaerotignum sp.]
MIAAAVTSVLSFISTNIDDIFILMLFFAQETKPCRKRQIVYGQYLGIFSTVAVSMAGAWILKLISLERLHFLGLVPLGMGIREIVVYFKGETQEQDEEKLPLKENRKPLFSVMFLAIANGADNVGVYIPLLAGYQTGQLVIFCIVFAVMIRLWCRIAERIVSLEALGGFLRKYRHVIVPVVLIGLGISILTGSLF